MSDTTIEQKAANPKAEEWAERIAEQRRSGMSVKQFCKERGLTEYSFYAWRKRLQEEGLVRFALVERSPRRQERTAEAALELVLATGERLRIGAGERAGGSCPQDVHHGPQGRGVMMKKELLSSKVIGTDDTSVKILDRKLPFARIGRIWPYVGDAHHPVIVYDYTPTRSRAGPAKFLDGYKGYLQADAYSVYDAFFKSQRGMTEVGCWMHAPRYFFKAVESDEPHMGPVLHLIARLYAVEERQGAIAFGGNGWHCVSGCRRGCSARSTGIC